MRTEDLIAGDIETAVEKLTDMISDLQNKLDTREDIIERLERELHDALLTVEMWESHRCEG